MKIAILLILLLLVIVPSSSATAIIQKAIDQPTSTNTFPFGGNDNFGQTFTTIWNQTNIYNVSIYIDPGTGPTTLSLYTSTAKTTLLGTAIDSTTGFGWHEYKFAYPIPVSPLTTYYWEVSWGSIFIPKVQYSSVNPYSGGYGIRSGTPLASTDWQFAIYMDPHTMVGNWTFDEGTGAWANDTSGFNNNGTITGTNWTSLDSVHGSALAFDGSGDWVDIPHNDSLNVSNVISMSGWLKPVAYGGKLFFKDTWGFDTAINTLRFCGTGGCADSTKLPALNRWSFVTVTFDGTTTRFYMDGVDEALTTALIVQNSSSNLRIGSDLAGANVFNGTYDEFKYFNYVLNQSEITALYQEFQPVPAYPTNGITIAATYPPQTTSVNFSWHDSVYPSDEIIVSKDANFNIIVIDEFTSSDFKLATLDSGLKYYWKVRQFNGTTGSYGITSRTENFTISSGTGASGQGVEGVVYELRGGLITPISGATVYIYNSTWTSTTQTGSNGYYLFSGMANGVYNVYSKKQGYDDAPLFPVTVNGSISKYDILMRIYISPYVPNFVFEKFVVRGLFDNSFSGVTVNVYKDGDAAPSFTGVTDSMGSVVFQLIKDQYYRVTFSGGGLESTITVYIYAKEESYFVKVLTGFPTTGDRFNDISTNLSVSTINSTWSYLTLSYNDTRGSTSQINFYARNLSTGVTCYLSSTASVATLSCPVYARGIYQFGFNATSSIYGTFQEDKIVNFDAGLPNTPSVNTTVDKTLLQWGSIVLIVLTAALFSYRTVKYGAVIVPLEALVLWVFGWFEPMQNNAVGSFLLLSCAVVIGVMVYLRASEIKVNF